MKRSPMARGKSSLSRKAVLKRKAMEIQTQSFLMMGDAEVKGNGFDSRRFHQITHLAQELKDRLNELRTGREPKSPITHIPRQIPGTRDAQGVSMPR